MIYQRLAKVFLICSDINPLKIYRRPGLRAGTQPLALKFSQGASPMGAAGAYYVYILASGRHGTLYIGVTNNPRVRLEQHRAGLGSKFVKQYGVHRLVHVEEFASPQEAIAR
jgi:predicted GIY-YIG superfamily endonuclease